MKVSSTWSPSAEQVTWNLESHWSGTLCSKAPKFSKHLTLARLPLMICKLRSRCELLRKALEQLGEWVSSCFPGSAALLPRPLQHTVYRESETRLADFSTMTSMKAKTKSRNLSAITCALNMAVWFIGSQSTPDLPPHGNSLPASWKDRF